MSQEFTLTRSNGRDLAIYGELLGCGREDSEIDGWHRGTDVDIYQTREGYVVHVRQWCRWRGTPNLHNTRTCKTPIDVLEWLMNNEGQVGSAAAQALWAAARMDAGIASIMEEKG